MSRQRQDTFIKYKNFKAQVPDFDFSTFYSELDKYFGSAEEVLKPQGKDCVFADEQQCKSEYLC